MNFLRRHWYDIGGLAAVAVVIGIINGWQHFSPYRLLMWVSFLSLLLHQLEEYRIVGTFPGMLNTVLYRSSAPDRYPLNPNTALVVNVFVGWPLYLLAAVFAERAVWLGVATMVVSLANTIAHTTLFNIKGKTLYNAGLATCWILFVPIIILFLLVTRRSSLLMSSDYLIGIPLGIFLNVVGILKPIRWMADIHTPYRFPQRALLPRDRKSV